MNFLSFTAKADRLFEDISMLENKLDAVDGEPIADPDNNAQIILQDGFYPSAAASAWSVRLNAQQILNF